jgi:hypothetical protein
MHRLDQKELVRSQSCRVSVNKLKVFDDKDELVYPNEWKRTRESIDVADPEKFCTPAIITVPVQPSPGQLKIEAKPNILFKDR